MSDSKVTTEYVWQKTTPGMQQEIVDFWSKNNMLPPGASPAQRVREVVLVVRATETHEIVGIVSAALIQFKQLNNNYFFLFRLIVLPRFRMPGLIFKVAVGARDVLEAYAATMVEHKPIGVLTFVENPKLISGLNEAVWPATKMVYIGNDKDGRQIRVYYFKGARI